MPAITRIQLSTSLGSVAAQVDVDITATYGKDEHHYTARVDLAKGLVAAAPALAAQLVRVLMGR